MTFDNIRLDKGLYTTGKSFTQALESIDPSENYIGTELEGLDAFQRQLKRFDIKVSGRNSDPIEKFFRTTDSAALFPEYVSRSVAQGIDTSSILDSIIATTTKIEGLDYRSITTENSDENFEPSLIAEGSFVPETKVVTKDKLVKLHKCGRLLSASYEAIRFQRIDLFSVALRQIGAGIARAQLSEAIRILIEGDGTASNAPLLENEGGPITYNDLLNIWHNLHPHNLTTLIAAPDTVLQLLKLPEFRDSYKGLDFHSTGKMITPLGAELFKSSDVPLSSIIGFDKTCTLEKVEAMPVTTEYDKLIDRQLERAAITTISGFSKIYDDSCVAMTCV